MKFISQLVTNVKNASSQKGFTMIELLIVIAILGILAVAVLSAINPVEQINRGRDTGSRSDAEQLLSAIDRFNAFQGYVPWRTGANDAGADALAWTALTDLAWANWTDTSGTCPVLEKISNASPTGTDACTTHADELKATFISRIIGSSYNHMFVYNGGSVGQSTYVCFAPKSKAFAQEAANRLDTDGDGTNDNIPDDYPPSAYSNVADCGTEGYCTCLP